MVHSPMSSRICRYRDRSMVRLPPIDQIFDLPSPRLSTLRSPNITQLSSYWDGKVEETDTSDRSWFINNETDEDAEHLLDYKKFLVNVLQEKFNVDDFGEIDSQSLVGLFFQQRKDYISYKVKVTSGPVTTKKPASKNHAVKERGRRSHQRETLEATDLTSSDFIRDISARYIEQVKEHQELKMQREAELDGRNYTIRTRSGNLFGKVSTKPPNKDEVHVRILFTTLLSAFIISRLQRQQGDYNTLRAYTDSVEAERNDLCAQIARQTHPNIPLDTTAECYKPQFGRPNGPAAPKPVQCMDIADIMCQEQHSQLKLCNGDTKSHRYSLPSPAPSSAESSCQSSFSS